VKIKDPNIRSILETHAFSRDRGLNEYIDIFGFPFVDALKALNSSHHWLDAGAGEGKAMREFLLASSKPDIFTTAVTLKISQKINSPTHKTIVNYLEDLLQENIRPCDIITDVEGGVQFTEQLDHLLKRYLLWMKPAGILFLYVKPESTFVGEETFSVWLRRIPGLRITDGLVPGALIIEKENKPHALPRLKLVETKVNGEFIRKFKES
jgi:hypothetical protein